MKQKPHLLIVDDEPNIRRILQVAFEKIGYTCTTAEDGYQALDLVTQEDVHIVLSDVTMPLLTGYELLKQVKLVKPQLPFVIMTAFGTIPQAIQAIRDGAYEYVTKPFDLDHLKKIVASALADSAVAVKAQKPQVKSQKAFIAESAAMVAVYELIEKVADSKATVLITGESGVGKEVVAKALHRLSGRNQEAFVAVSCAALPETLLESELFGYEKGAFTGANQSKTGRFELANAGTLFLDEIGDIPLATQVKLLRVLQEREFERLGSSKPTKIDVRLITATNRDLQQSVSEGTFRLDLLYRLQVIEIMIPALRDRIEDIAPLAEHFLQKFAVENGREPLVIGEAALALLHSYSWPGNVRELENMMERATILSLPEEAELRPEALPLQILKNVA